MRAVQFLGDRQAVVVDQPDPEPGPGQMVVRMVRAAVCGSDLHGYRRPAGEVPRLSVFPGHEPVGVVAAAWPRRDRRDEGQRVLIYHRPGCGACPQCLARRARTSAPARRASAHRRGRRLFALLGRPGAPDARRSRLGHGRRHCLPGRDGLRAATPAGRQRARRAGRLRPRPGRPVRGRARAGDGRDDHRHRPDAGAAHARPNASAPPCRSTRGRRPGRPGARPRARGRRRRDRDLRQPGRPGQGDRVRCGSKGRPS